MYPISGRRVVYTNVHNAKGSFLFVIPFMHMYLHTSSYLSMKKFLVFVFVLFLHPQ